MSDSAAWQQIAGPPGASFVDGRIHYDKATRDHLVANFCIPQTFVTGIDPAKWDAAVGPHWWPQSVELPSNTSTSNERSKPVGLTRDHKYTDNDGDTLLIAEADEDEPLAIAWIDKLSNPCGFNVTVENTVPLALNVLGHDRPTLGDWALSSTVVVRGDGHREELLAQAAANLRAIDLYDQHVVKKKADDEAAAKAAEIAAAKARVEVANREIAERHLRKAKDAYNNAIIDAYRWGVSPASTATLQSALSAYETARRKVEGLPN